MLTTTDHHRDSAGLRYVYPVISRRSNGLSIGVNLNPNNACNWRCIYCQVPDLVRGTAPEIDQHQLQQEMTEFLNDVLHGDFYDRHEVDQSFRTIKDIAISGNGEPTSVRNFDQIIDLLGRLIDQFDLHSKLVLITNGSLVHKKTVRSGIAAMPDLQGEVWFKLDAVTNANLARINHTRLSIRKVKENLKCVSDLCLVWLQTCVFELDGQVSLHSERQAYLQFLSDLQTDGIKVEGILLYGLARPSMQPDASRLSVVSEQWANNMIRDINQLGFKASFFP